VVVGLWPEDMRWQLFSRSPDFSGTSLIFSDHRADHTNWDHLAVPDGCDLLPIDQSLFEHCIGKSHYLSMYDITQQALKKGYGVCLAERSELLFEAFTGPAAQGCIEIEMATHTDHRYKGYVTLTCSTLIMQMEQHGYRTCGSCARDNHASIGLARKLGYQTERGHRLLAWLKKADWQETA
jgi:hypothetical protein